MKTKMIQLVIPVLLALMMALSLDGWGQILTFEFSSLAGNEETAPSNTNDINLTASTISRGAGLTASANGGRFNATNWALTSIENAVSGNDYMEFTITPQAGYQFSVSSIVVQWQRSATGNTAIALRSSVNDYATDLDAVKSVTDNTSTQTFTWTFSQANNSSAVTYRFYSYAEATTGSGGPGDGTGNDIVVNGTTSATGGSSPTITVTPSTLTGFTYILGAGPSAEQSFSVSGSNLTADISITPSTNYEISTGTGVAFTPTNPITLSPTGGTVSSTPVYVRLKAGLSTGDFNNEVITASSTGADNKTVTCSGSVTDPISEPTNHPTGFGATANSASAITVNWTDAVPAADGYLIKGSSIGYGDIVSPVDGSAEADGTLVKNVADGVESHQFTGLTAETDYFFKIFPYNGSGATINYKTDGSVPEANATTQAITITTYTWIGADNASWTDASNWNPTRSIPESNDILQFNDGTTKTVTSVPAQTIGKLLITGNTNLTLQAGVAGTLTIAGGAENDLLVASGSQLNISGATALSLSLSAGATASISGSMTFAGAAHKLLAADAAGITFNSGSSFTAGTSFSGNPFGNTISGSVIFTSGSTFIYIAGSNPFAIANSVTVFETGSLYKHQSTNTPSFSGRTYANFEFDFNGSVIVTGTGAVNMDNLKITQGTFNFNVTATPGHSIKGNIEVSGGATLNFTPASAGTVNLNGTSPQTISGGGTISAGANSTIIVSNSTGVWLNNNALLNNFTIASDCHFVISTNNSLTVNGTLTNNAGNPGLVIESDATGSGSLIHNTNNVPATVQRFLTGNTVLTSKHYHQLSFPLNASITAGEFLGSYLWKWDHATQAFASFGSSTSTPVPNNQGYLIFYPGASFTYDFAGQLNNGTFSVPLGQNNADFTLAPNPYPSAINWNTGAGWTRTNLEGTYWIWSPLDGNYANYNGTIGTLGATEFIPAGQAFFVKANAGSPVLELNNNARTHSNQAYFNAQQINNLFIITARANNYRDEAVVYFDQQAEIIYDAKDAGKFYGAAEAPQLFSKSADNEKLSINVLPYAQTTVIVPLGFEISESTESILYFDGIDSFESTVTIFLEDKLTNEMIDLKLISQYTFQHNAANDPERFNLHFFGVTGIDMPEAKSDYQIWSSDRKVYINIPEFAGKNARIEMFDVLGNKLFNSEGVLNSPAVVRAMNSGVAIVRVSSANKVYTTKLFIQ